MRRRLHFCFITYSWIRLPVRQTVCREHLQIARGNSENTVYLSIKAEAPINVKRNKQIKVKLSEFELEHFSVVNIQRKYKVTTWCDCRLFSAKIFGVEGGKRTDCV